MKNSWPNKKYILIKWQYLRQMDITEKNNAKYMKLRNDLNDLTLAREENLDKTLKKGIESRKEEIISIQTSLDAIKDLADKQQVTQSVGKCRSNSSGNQDTPILFEHGIQ